MKKTIDLKQRFKTVRTNLKKIYFFLQNERLFLQTFEKTNCFLMNERFFSKNLKKQIVFLMNECLLEQSFTEKTNNERMK